MHKLRLTLIAALCCGLFTLSLASTASAAQCVGVTLPECPVEKWTPSNDGIWGALNDAAQATNPADKVVVIAPGTYSIKHAGNTSPNLPAFPVLGSHAANGPIHVRGAGIGKTILTGEAHAMGLVRVWFPTPDSTLSGVTIEPQTSGTNQFGLLTVIGQVSDVAVNEVAGTAQDLRAVQVGSDTRLERSSISTVGWNAMGLTTSSGVSNVVVDQVDVDAVGPSSSNGVWTTPNQAAADPTVNLRRISVRGYKVGIKANSRRTIVTDSLIDLTSANVRDGVLVSSYSAGVAETIDFEARRTTIVGTGSSQEGVILQKDAAESDLINADLVDTVIAVGGQPLSCYPDSNRMQVTNVAATGTQANCENATTNNVGDLIALTGSPFVDAANGDFRPLKSSPLVEGGATTAEIPLGAVDLAGSPRISGGAVDIGAFEYQHHAPQVTLAVTKDKLANGEAVSFTATASDADDDAASLTLSWQVDGVAKAGNGLTLTESFKQAGSHNVTFSATDPFGFTDSASVAVTVAKPPAARLTVKPKKTFKRGKKSFSVMKAAKTKKAKRKAKKTPSFSVRFTESTRAKLVLLAKRGKKFKALKRTQTLRVKNGTSKLTFGGGWNKKRLKRGTYRVQITPVNSVGTAGKRITVTLRVR